jgi:hypothetical protein
MEIENVKNCNHIFCAFHSYQYALFFAERLVYPVVPEK